MEPEKKEISKVAKPVETQLEVQMVSMEDFLKLVEAMPPGITIPEEQVDATLQAALRRLQRKEP